MPVHLVNIQEIIIYAIFTNWNPFYKIVINIIFLPGK